MDMAEIFPILERQVRISEGNKGPVVNISAWLGMTIMILCVGTRIGSKFSIMRRWTIDDTLIFVAMILASIHTGTLSVMVTNGLGQHQSTLTEKMLALYQKFGYVSELLYIPSLCLAKLSALFYLETLSPTEHHITEVQCLKIFIYLWGLSSEFAIAFQCSVPTPWAILSTKCFNRSAFWDVTGIFDILTDVAMIFFPVDLVWSLQMSWKKKLVVFFAFATRALILPFTIFRLHSLSTSSSSKILDQTSASYHAYLATTIQLNFAIIAACLPFLKPFMENMSSGGLVPIVNDADGSYIMGSSGNKSVSKLSKSKNTTTQGANIKMDTFARSNMERSQNTTHANSDEVPYAQRPDFPHKRSHFKVLEDDDSGNEHLGPLRPDLGINVSHIGRSTTKEEIERRVSNGSDKMIIIRTTAWGVQEEYESSREGGPASREISVEDNVEKDWANKGTHYHI